MHFAFVPVEPGLQAMLDSVAAKLTCCLFCRFSYRWCCASKAADPDAPSAA
jgi:hypothetical protein